MDSKPSKSGSSSKIIRITAGAAIAIIAGSAFFTATLSGCSKKAEKPGTDFVMDDNAVEGGWNKIDEAKVREGLNAGVEEGYINISMNTTPFFEDGESEGNLMIVNESVNRYPQKVVITRNDSGDVVYESGGIPVGSKIEKAKLLKNLPAGTYECTAMFHNVNPETGESLGCAGAIINITVKN